MSSKQQYTIEIPRFDLSVLAFRIRNNNWQIKQLGAEINYKRHNRDASLILVGVSLVG